MNGISSNATVDQPPGLGLLDLAPRWPSMSSGGILTYALAAVLAYICWEQISFSLKRRTKSGKQVPGPNRPVPLVGGLVEMVMDPYGFWERQRLTSFPGISYNSIFGVFMIFSTDVDVSRKLFSINDPDSLLMAVHPSGKNILGEKNLAFMHGPPHKAIRKSFLALFTRKALSTYVTIQDGIIRDHIAAWLRDFGGQERDIREYIRDMNAYTSQEVFAGPYLKDAKLRAKFSHSFRQMTDGFLAFPVCLPGTAVWRGKQGRLYILTVLREAAQQSKDAMKAGGEPRCLMDFWAVRCMEEAREAEAAGVPPPEHTTNSAMADTIMDFLFASQDASTASLVWLTCLLAHHPDVLAKVREEQVRLRPDLGAPISGEVLGEMTYTRQVVKEVLRYRPPAPMVPQVAQKPFPLTEDYTAPKGALLMPSIIAATMQGFTDPERFDPDRFSEARKEDIKFQKNFLTFGYGPHYCVGKEYAINHLMAYLALASTSCQWTWRKDWQVEEWKYLPTIYPKDSFITLNPYEPKA